MLVLLRVAALLLSAAKNPIPQLPHPLAIRRFVYQAASRSGTVCARNVRLKGMTEILFIVWGESRNDPNCRNPRSTSTGLNGFLNSTYRDLGLKKTSDPHAQLQAMFLYIDRRYGGSPERAMRFWRKHRWY